MKKFVHVAALLILFCLQANSQIERNQTLSRALEIYNKSPKALGVELAGRGYEFRKQQGNFYTYTKKTRISAYDFMFAVRNNKVSAFSWDEFIGHIDFLNGELNALNLKLYVNKNLGDQQFRSYQNLNRNLMVTITTKGNYFTIVVGAKDSNKPIVYTSQSQLGVTPLAPKSIQAYAKSTQEPEERKIKPDSYCSPKTPYSKILAKPLKTAIYPSWKNKRISEGSFFYISEKVVNSNGVFYLGDLMNSDGTVDRNGEGPYYIIASEWDSEYIEYE